MWKRSPALRVLVVDDEPLIRWSLLETLAGLEYSVVEAADASSAMRAVAAAGEPFDVALLDFRLPDSDDLALLARLRQTAPGMQVVLMTAFGTPEIHREAVDLGAYCVIEKPFEMQDIASLVARACAGRLQETPRDFPPIAA